MRVFAVLVASLLLASPSRAQAPANTGAALTDAAIIDLVSRLPAFAAGGGRASVSVARQMEIPGSGGCGHFAEIVWREGETYRGALLAVGCTDAPHLAEATWLARHGRWGVLSVQEDQTWQDLIRQLGDARIDSFEAATVGRVRAMVSAQYTFAAISGGSYAADVDCLLTPAACGVASDSPFLYDAKFKEPEGSGYRFTLHPGAKTTTSANGRALIGSFAYTAEPLTPGETGRRSFCGDSAGFVCQRDDGQPFQVRGGACPANCAPVR